MSYELNKITKWKQGKTKQQERNFFEKDFYPSGKKFVTNNIFYSVTNSMSALHINLQLSKLWIFHVCPHLEKEYYKSYKGESINIPLVVGY